MVPYGLVTASHVLNAVASTALRHISHLASAFVDDIIIAAPKVPGLTLDEAFALQLQAIRAVLGALRAAGLTASAARSRGSR